MESTQISVYRWSKQNEICTYNGIVLSLKKEWNSDVCYNMDEPWGLYAKWNKPVTKRQILYDSTYILEVVKIIETEGGCHRLGGGETESCFMATEYPFLKMKKLWRWAVQQGKYS